MANQRTFRALLKRRDGATAVEFAMIAIPFFWLLFAMAEFGAMSLAQTNLDNALAETGRKIRTGIAQTGGMTKADLQDEICDNLNSIMAMDCNGNLHLDVDRYDSFGNVNNGGPLNGGAVDAGQLSYTPGGADEVILVRAYYQWEIFTPMFGAVFANMSDGQRLLVSSMLFRNEPF